jgi:hypothetical protein
MSPTAGLMIDSPGPSAGLARDRERNRLPEPSVRRLAGGQQRTPGREIGSSVAPHPRGRMPWRTGECNTEAAGGDDRLPPVGLLCDYFAAPTDETAASTIDWIGGPSQRKGPKQRLFRRGPSREPFRTVDMTGVEPTVQMATLEAILTGRSITEILEETTRLIIADRDHGERVVVRLTPSLQAALAQATDDELATAVERWSETDEFWGQGDPATLQPLVGQLGALARDASQKGLRLYCWVCV